MNFFARAAFRSLPRRFSRLFTLPSAKSQFLRISSIRLGGILSLLYMAHNTVSNKTPACWGLTSTTKYKPLETAFQSLVVIYSSKTNKPVASGIMINSSGAFVTITNFAPFLHEEDPNKISTIRSEFYCKLYSNDQSSEERLYFTVDVLIKEENLVICKIESSTVSTIQPEGGPKYHVPTFDTGVSIGERVVVLGKSEKGLNFIKESFVTEPHIDPVSLLPADSTGLKPGPSIIINSGKIPHSLFGGPVLNQEGKIVGLIYPTEPTELDGQTSVVPTWFLEPLIAEYNKNGNKLARAFIGMSIKTSSEGHGAFVIRVNSESPAATAGVKMGDKIVQANGVHINSSHDFSKMIGYSHGKKYDLVIERNGKKENVTLQI